MVLLSNEAGIVKSGLILVEPNNANNTTFDFIIENRGIFNKNETRIQ